MRPVVQSRPTPLLWSHARRAILLLAVPGLLSLATPTRAGINTWTGSGPDGGVVRALAIDPLTPTTVYAGAGSRLFKSTNGAASWSPADAGLSGAEVRALAVDPTAPSTLYAVTWFTGVFKSTNGAAAGRRSTRGCPRTPSWRW